MLLVRRGRTLDCLISTTFLIHSAICGCFGISQLSTPTIGTDQVIYACTNKEVVAFWGNGTRAWRAQMNQTCQTNIAPVIDYKGRVYVAADSTIVVVTPPSLEASSLSTANFLGMVPSQSLKAIGNYSIKGLAVTSWSSVLYINTGTGIHAFMLDGTPLWSSLVQFNNSLMKSPEALRSCAKHLTNCMFLSSPAVDECDGTIYVARTDGWVYALTTWQPFLKWRFSLNVKVPSTSVKVVAGNNGHVYVSASEHSLVYALSARLGKLVWKVKVGPLGKRSGIPIIDLAGYVSIVSLDGFTYVISPDGTGLRRYLADDILSPVSIQTPPILDCSGSTIYVAQSVVDSKLIDHVDESDVVSFSKSLGINIWMLVPSSGQVLWSTWYPGYFPSAMLLGDLSLYMIDSDWLIALSAAANLSGKSLCQAQRNNKQIMFFAISLLVIFLLLSVFSVLIYLCWRRNQARLCQKICGLLKQERFRHPQGTLLRKKIAYEHTLKRLQAQLEFQPNSKQLVKELQATLEGLHFIDRYLSSFPLDTVVDIHQDTLLAHQISSAKSLSSSFESGNSPECLGWLQKSLQKRRGGSSQCKDDLVEDRYLLSSCTDVPIEISEGKSFSVNVLTETSKCKSSCIDESTTSTSTESLVGKSKPYTQSRMSKTQGPYNSQKAGSEVKSPCVEVELSTAEFTNPLYKERLRPLVPANTLRKRMVTFSPVNEIFEESTSEEGDSITGMLIMDVDNGTHHPNDGPSC